MDRGCVETREGGAAGIIGNTSKAITNIPLNGMNMKVYADFHMNR